MRLLRYSGALILACSLVGCGDDGETTDDSNNDDTTSTTSNSTGPSNNESTSGPPATDDGPPPGDSSSSGAGSSGTAGSSDGEDDNGMGQACGNGAIEGTEQCDCGSDDKGNPMPCSPAGLDGQQCAGLTNPSFPDRVYTGGILDCNPASCQFSFNTCSFCGDTVLNGNEVCELDDDPGPSCQALGQGASTTPLPCGPSCQWYTECCDPETAPKDCP